ncbi:uncharacterized protein A1O5_05576 [Cladophialophora psammophila CBS 110553]|uniref:Glutathione S-transferase UstS-like C-terminal domain-containing protein n=1 Tax=Cladophialophora psammophila CBS 110553 TaxID=1182543 RepID=W9X4B0_9EURO|nr:uncharacterized protein A1O5_05576 [Cladophialophora psammophila CBS 110553]EXJ71766.1 hypothetical protein A1O5_05576 [Cladophialophora psammophila CBS 110553]
MSQQIILYDLPTRAPRRCWSLNPWKTRMLLNYKRLNYQTVWVEYPDVEALIKPHTSSIAVCPRMLTAYPTQSLPFKCLAANGLWTQERLQSVLSSCTPEPALNIATDPYLAEIKDLANRIAKIVSPDFIPKIANRVLGDESLGYWHRTREEWFGGQKLDKVVVEKGGTQVYQEAGPLVMRVTELLVSNPAGPYFQGRVVSYADFIWASLLHFFENLADDSFEMLIGSKPTCHVALLEACRLWLARNDH